MTLVDWLQVTFFVRHNALTQIIIALISPHLKLFNDGLLISNPLQQWLLTQWKSLNIRSGLIVELWLQIKQNIEVTYEVMSLEDVSDVGFPLIQLIVHEIGVAYTHLTFHDEQHLCELVSLLVQHWGLILVTEDQPWFQAKC